MQNVHVVHKQVQLAPLQLKVQQAPGALAADRQAQQHFRGFLNCSAIMQLATEQMAGRPGQHQPWESPGVLSVTCA